MIEQHPTTNIKNPYSVETILKMFECHDPLLSASLGCPGGSCIGSGSGGNRFHLLRTGVVVWWPLCPGNRACFAERPGDSHDLGDARSVQQGENSKAG